LRYPPVWRAPMTTATEAPPPAGRRRAVTALGITQILAWGSSFYLLAVLADPIVHDTGWPRGAVVGGISLGLFVSGLASMRVGSAIERLGGRPVLGASSVLLAAGLALVAVAPSLPIYLAAWLVLGLGMGAGLYDAAFSTLGRMFGRSARSAITEVTLWGGFASTVCWPLSAILVESVGWRATCLVYAGLHLAVALPLHLLALPREYVRSESTRAAGSSAAPDLATSPPSRILLLLAVILTTGGAIAAAISVHLIVVLQAGGLSLAAAVGLGALVGPSQVGARVIEMFVGRSHHPLWTLTAAALLILTGLALLSLGFFLPAIALISYGAGNGVWSIARGAVPLELFGGSGYAALMGRLAAPIFLAQAAAPSVAALLIVQFGAAGLLVALTLLALANVILILWLWTATRELRARSIA
jgi:predicted MFS family arabinose efflux permease